MNLGAAKAQASRWLEIADKLVQFGDEPSVAEMQALFTQLDVRGRLRTGKEVDSLLEEFEGRGIPFVSWLEVKSFQIDSEVVSEGAALPCP